jgi:hypothetical protein
MVRFPAGDPRPGAQHGWLRLTLMNPATTADTVNGLLDDIVPIAGQVGANGD